MDSIKLSFLGDISFNDDYVRLAEEGINPFVDVEPLLGNSDFVVGNLECTVGGDTDNYSIKKTRLKTSTKALDYLKSLNLCLVTLANNHIYDNLYQGFKSTVDFLDKNSIEHIGAHEGSTVEGIKIIDIKGNRFAFLNYLHDATNPLFPKNCMIKVNMYKKERIIRDIRVAKKKADFIVLLFHWGVEDSSYPAPWQRRHSRQFIQAGANFIIGHHTHVIQGYEEYKSGFVFYSLGNFCFSNLETPEKIYEINRQKHTRAFILHLEIFAENRFKTEYTLIINNKNFISLSKDRFLKQNIERKKKLIPLVSRYPIYLLYLIYVKFIYKIYFYFKGNNRIFFQRLKEIDSKKIKRAFVVFSRLFKK